MSEESKIMIEFTKFELLIMINALISASPKKEDEVDIFKLYHKLLFRLNECDK
jgi:hypothetical protein